MTHLEEMVKLVDNETKIRVGILDRRQNNMYREFKKAVTKDKVFKAAYEELTKCSCNFNLVIGIRHKPSYLLIVTEGSIVDK